MLTTGLTFMVAMMLVMLPCLARMGVPGGAVGGCISHRGLRGGVLWLDRAQGRTADPDQGDQGWGESEGKGTGERFGHD